MERDIVKILEENSRLACFGNKDISDCFQVKDK